MSIKIKSVNVVEGNLYERYGEDEKLICFDCRIEAIGEDGFIYFHHHLFKGYKEDEDGIGYADPNALPNAQKLADRVLATGQINPQYWEKHIHVDDVEDPMDRLQREWSDNSDHFTN